MSVKPPASSEGMIADVLKLALQSSRKTTKIGRTDNGARIVFRSYVFDLIPLGEQCGDRVQITVTIRGAKLPIFSSRNFPPEIWTQARKRLVEEEKCEVEKLWYSLRQELDRGNG